MLKRALEELDNEVAVYKKLSGLLDQQFQTFQQLDVASLATVSEAIVQEVKWLDERRRARAQLLYGAATLANSLPVAQGQAAHHAVEKRCVELKRLAMQCRASTLRNGQLLAFQYDVIQRVFCGANQYRTSASDMPSAASRVLTKT